jgi:hypothetical protein
MLRSPDSEYLTCVRRPFRILTVGALALSASCGLLAGLEPLEYSTSTDGSPDEIILDAASADAGSDADDDAARTFEDPARWSSYGNAGVGWSAGPFDGRYVYFVNALPVSLDAGRPPRVLRLDTTMEDAFESDVAWTAFDLTNVSATLGEHLASVFDGRFLWLVPFSDATGNPSGLFARYDTQSAAGFANAASWTTFDATSLSSIANRFFAAAHLDGGSYFARNGSLRPVLRHVGNDLDSGWAVADPAAGLPCIGVRGAACAGAAMFFGPNGGSPSCLVRYDTRQAIDASSAWEAFAFTSDDAGADRFSGMIATTTHLYMTPRPPAGADAAALTDGFKIVRKVVDGPLDAGWATRSVARSNPAAAEYFGGASDGRYVYFAPFPATIVNGIVYLRYDTTAPFDDDGAWSAVMNYQVNVSASQALGAVFDGKYVYYAGRTGKMVRYRARDDRIAPMPTCAPN